MKRGAENQMTKDDTDGRTNDEDDEPGQGFRKADDAALAARVIRSLPKRAGRTLGPAASAGPATFSSSTLGPTLSAGPSLFGSPTPTPGSSFNFGSTLGPSSSTSSAPSNPFGTTSSPFGTSSNLFGVPAKPSGSSSFSAPSSSPFAPSSSGPTVAPAATNTSKLLASFLDTSTPSATTTEPQASATPSTSLSSSTDAKADDSSALKYYTNLRGLNTSLSNAISSAIEKDPFADVSGLLEQYKTHRVKVQKEYDSAAASSKPTSSTNGTDSMMSMPAPPASFGGFGGSTSKLTAPTPPVAASSPFPSGGSSSSATSSNKPSGFLFGGSASSTKTESSLFSLPSKATDSSSKSSDVPMGSLPFKFGASSSATDISSKDAPLGSLPFKFGGGSSSTSDTPSKDSPMGSLPFKFGSSSSDSKSSSSLFGAPAADKDKQSFSFGSSSSSSPFGASASSTTGGAFGGITSKPSAFGSGFQFGASTPSDSSTPKVDPPSRTGTPAEDAKSVVSEGDAGDTEGPKLAMGVNPHDEEGEGEENEETVHSVKLKAYRLRKSDDKAGTGWAELGVGILRIKRTKDSESRRLLLRNSTNGKIHINFRLYSGLQPSWSKKALTFVGHDEGASTTYCVRLPSEENAKLLKEALDREIAAVKAAEGS